MSGNAQCERCLSYALPAYSTERLCDECKRIVRDLLRKLLDEFDRKT